MSDKNLLNRRNPYRPIRWLASVILSSSLLAACGGGSNSSTPPVSPPKLSGQSSFVSADPSLSSVNFATSTIQATAATANASDSSRTVQEGDIYHVLDNGKTILNVNPYRGLQIVDIRDVSKPSVIGRAAMAGSPVEMYRVDNRVYVLLNSYKSFQRALRDGQESLDSFYGAAVVEVDISQTTAPRILSTTRLPGYIQTSRMTSGDGKNALFLAVSDYSNLTAGSLTKVHSYALNAQGVTAKSVLELGGHVLAIAATGDRLLVARNPDWPRNIASKVAVIDISNTEGVMRLGADVQVAGAVRAKNNMDVTGNVLRIVSGDFARVFSANLPLNTDNIINTNHIETFDISDITQPKARDHKTFGDGQQLFATTFMQDRAFFVSYLRTDPFHAFSISATGMLQEENEFIVSGWNDFFKPVHNNSRLIGVGHNDENNRRVVSVSLYDSSNLKNRQPLIVRADTDLANSWSEANWDDRAFTVLENATNVLALDGKTVETGLVLLPYSGWDSASNEYRSGVQTFSFSSNTLTRRGTMLQTSTVRRSFLPQSQIAANLSDSELSLFDLQNLNQPVQRASLSLAESYSQFVAFAKVGARYRNNANSWNSQHPTPETVEFVSLDAANGQTILGKIAVPYGSRLYNVGEKLVVVSKVTADDRSTVAIWDISNPALAVLLGKVTSPEIIEATSGDYFSSNMLSDSALLPYYGQSEAKVVGNALVFVKNSWQPQYAKGDATSVIGYTTKLRLSIVDLSNPAAPRFQSKIELEEKQNSVGVIVNGNNLWLNYKVEATANTNLQAQAKYFVKRLDLSTPSAPIMSGEINIPGQLMAVAGNQLYTKDFHWTTNNTIENSLNALTLQDELAYRQASNVLANQLVTSLHLDGANIVVSLQGNDYSSKARASLFTLQNNNFVAKSTMEMPVWGTVSQVRNGKVLFDIYGGYLLYDFTQTIPVPQAFFNISGWGSTSSLAGTKIYIPAYLYGIYQFDFDTVNLSKPGA